LAVRTRPYRSVVRTRQAEATRSAILAAARRLFVSAGYQGTTIEAIAAQAEVSVATVYLDFGSKVAILTALVAGAGGDPDIRALAKRTAAETDPGRKLRKAAHVMRVLMEREADLLDLLWQAGSGHPDLVAAWRQMHANRHRTLTAALEQVVGARGPADRRRAVDVAWAMSSPEVYRLLVAERGWSSAAFERWLSEALVSQLLGPSHRSSPAVSMKVPGISTPRLTAERH
jgi:AcrR family transcriptional regulator